MAPLLSPTPETLVTHGWSDYALLDSGDGRKLERYGPYTVVRPEPQCFWSPRDPAAFGRPLSFLGSRARSACIQTVRSARGIDSRRCKPPPFSPAIVSGT